ncbi:MAG TPA: hypothetical protein DGT21_14605 [Armatimonadetes bacterium]|nr:hypothetical protein [Armatimonadota bacterium]
MANLACSDVVGKRLRDSCHNCEQMLAMRREIREALGKNLADVLFDADATLKSTREVVPEDNEAIRALDDLCNSLPKQQSM